MPLSPAQIHWPDRYVGGLFGASSYDVALEREGDIPFEEQLRGLDAVVKAGKVRCCPGPGSARAHAEQRAPQAPASV